MSDIFSSQTQEGRFSRNVNDSNGLRLSVNRNRYFLDRDRYFCGNIPYITWLVSSTNQHFYRQGFLSSARVCHSVNSGGGGVWQTPPSWQNPLGRQPPWQTPPGQTPPWAETPMGRYPLGRHPLGRHPLSRHPPRADTTPRQTATAVDGTHSTGMHSCLLESCVMSVNPVTFL